MVRVGKAWVCYLCDLLPGRFPPIECCDRDVDGKRCRLVKRHRGPCEPGRGGRAEPNPLRDGVADPLEKSHDPTFEARRRAGPHR